MSLLALISSLISVLNPIGAVPMFISFTSNRTPEEIKKISIKCTIYVFLILVIAFVSGNLIMDFFSISINSMKVAGGIIMLLSGVSFINNKRDTHKGINQKVKIEAIEKDGGDTAKFVAMAKDKTSGFRLMGFGHRVYKNFDPRARIIKKSCDEVLNDLGVQDKKLTIAMELEQAALNDDYFVSRKLYPNVDFYSGIIYKAMSFPTDTFTTLFALGRLPGWVSQWKELKENKEPIGRPRQIYLGATVRPYTDINNR